MSLSKSQNSEVDELAGKPTLKSISTNIMFFIFNAIVPLGLVTWLEFFNGFEKLDNIIVVYMIVMIGISLLFQSAALVIIICYAIFGDGIVEDSIKKNIKNGRGKKESAKLFFSISRYLRTTPVSVIKSLIKFSLICLLVYSGHTILGSFLMILFITYRFLMYYYKEIMDGLLKKYFLSKEDSKDENGKNNEIVIESIDVEIVE